MDFNLSFEMEKRCLPPQAIIKAFKLRRYLYPEYLTESLKSLECSKPSGSLLRKAAIEYVHGGHVGGPKQLKIFA